MKELLVTLLIVFTTVNCFAKKKLIEDKEQVIEAAVADLDKAMESPDGELYEWATENNVKGTYHVDITIHERGKVATVFCHGNEGGEIKYQNALKDILKEFKFSFKTPKGKDYKFSYSLSF